MNGAPLRASLRFAWLLLCAHAAAGAAGWISIGAAAGAALALLSMAAGISAIRRYALLLAGDSPASLAFDGAAELRIVDRIGRDWIPVVESPRYVCRWFVIIAASGPRGRVRRLVVTRDMLPPEPFRRLRIWALWVARPARAA